MATLCDQFAANLLAARQAKGLSQNDVALRSGLHRTEISLLERGGREPRLGTIIKLAGALDVPSEFLCTGIYWLPGENLEIREP
jgi:XRE family transcriptional regulator, regulator of sulfur utilization